MKTLSNFKPGTFTQIHIHIVFSVRNRQSLISNSWKDELYMYITGIVKQNKHKLLAINGMPDHLHILVGLATTQSISDLIQDIKGSSSKWINLNDKTKERFSWQEGYGAFAISKKAVPNVAAYIGNQEKHHSKTKFIDEFKEMLNENDVDFDERFIFNQIDIHLPNK